MHCNFHVHESLKSRKEVDGNVKNAFDLIFKFSYVKSNNVKRGYASVCFVIFSSRKPKGSRNLQKIEKESCEVY